MTVLLDTHLLLWSAAGSARVPKSVVEMIEDKSTKLAFSAVSIWEIVIKSASGRSDFRVNPYALRSHLLENEYMELTVSSNHCLAVAGLPAIHKDPFDRLLVAQAQVEGFTLLTADDVVASYAGPVRKV